MHCKRQPIVIANQMFQLPTQLSSIVFEIANARAIILINQYDHDPDREISNDKSEYPGKSTLSSNIEEDDVDIGQEVLHPEQAHRDKAMRATSVLQSKKCSRVDTVIARPPLPNLRHSVAAIAPPSLKRQKSAINILRGSDIVQVFLLSKACGDHIVPQPKAGGNRNVPQPKDGGDYNVPQPKASGDHNVPQHQKATFEVAKQFMEAIGFTKSPWHIISDEKYLVVDEA
jgi:hypothetical protein